MTRGAWKTALGYLIALVCLFWVFHDLPLRELRTSVERINWVWIAAAIFCDVASYAIQGWRWGELLKPLGRLSARRSTQAVYAGLFINEILPLRLGELLRSYLAARWIGAPVSKVIPSVVVERFLDGLWLATAVGMVASRVPLPKDLVVGGDILGAAVVAAAALFAVLVLRAGGRTVESTSTAQAQFGLLRRFRAWVDLQAAGLRAIGRSTRFWAAFGASPFVILLQGVAFWLVMKACHLDLPLYSGLAVFLIVHLGTALPNAPGNVGSYQFFCVVGLAFFGVDKPQAAAFSLVVFVLLTIPLWGIGYLALLRSGLTLRTARGEVARLRDRASGHSGERKTAEGGSS
jgi:glycosyltransferase 2 family protein